MASRFDLIIQTLMAILEMKHSSQSPHDVVLWELTDHDGKMIKSDLARRLKMRLSERDIVLWELERAGKFKLTEVRG